MKSKLTLLTEEQIWGDDQGKGQLQVLKIYGTKTGISDLAVLLGGYMGGSSVTSDNQRAGVVWSASSISGGLVRTIYGDGERGWAAAQATCSVRPALPPESMRELIASGAAIFSHKICDGKVDVWKYGEYPRNIIHGEFSKDRSHWTGRRYDFSNNRGADYVLWLAENMEYQHNGRRYIDVFAKPSDSDSMLSNGAKPKAGERYWLEVQPIEILLDPTGWGVMREGIVAGLQLQLDNPHGRNKPYDGNFENTRMHRFLNEFLWEDIQPSRNAEVSTQTALASSTPSPVVTDNGQATVPEFDNGRPR